MMINDYLHCIAMNRKREWSLFGEKVILVPYCTHHVEKYHSWMQDPVLREQTASEPLTLEQEYEMQRSWMEDSNKCTFIVLSKDLYCRPNSTEIESMVGDVNMFFCGTGERDTDYSTAEIDIMIAEPSCRGKGLASEATRLMMMYGALELGVQKFHAKIRYDNLLSLNLFQSRLQFAEISRSDVFREATLERLVSPEMKSEFERTVLKWELYKPNCIQFR